MSAEDQNSNGQQTMGQTAGQSAGQTPAPVPSQPAAQPAGLPPSVWNNLPDSENYIKFTPENAFRQKVTFVDNEPRQKPSTFQKAGEAQKMNYEFEVIDLLTPEPTVKTWSVSSIRLMRQLSAFLPLDNKSFDVQRVGEGMQIDYILTPLQ